MNVETQKTVWIINDYAGSPIHGMTHRHYYIAKEMKKHNIRPIIISASYSHFLTSLPKLDEKKYLIEEIDSIEYCWIKTLSYKNSHDKKRVLKWFQFMFKLMSLPKILDRPNAIICSGSAPMLIWTAYFLSKKYKAKLVFEVRDIWPLTLMELNGYSKYNPLIYIMQKASNFGFKHADTVISVLPYTDKYINSQGIYKFDFNYLPNGVSLDELNNIQPLSESVESLIPLNKFIVGYAGAMGLGDQLNLLIDAAKDLRGNNEIHFVLVGKGAEKDSLKRRVKELGLENVTFINPILKIEVQSMLQKFDVCYIGWSDKKIYEYGISANKIFDYMYAEKPILHVYSGKGDLIKNAQCGLSISNLEKESISKAVLKLYAFSEDERRTLGQKGKEYVLKTHTYEKITEKIIKIV